MKIIDCVTFFDEDILFDIRLNILNEDVDLFVVIESREDHQGRPKKLNFDIKKYSKFKDKINYIILDKLEFHNVKLAKNWTDGHLRDQYQRNYIKNVLIDLNVDYDDLVIISDLDEIPDLRKISKLDLEKNKIFIFEQMLLCYKLNLIDPKFKWYGSRACKYKYLKSPQWLRNIKPKNKFFNFFNKVKIISHGGWHFSYLKTPEKIINKLESFAHSEYNLDTIKKINEINSKIINGLDLVTGKKRYEKVTDLQLLPKYLIEKKDEFCDWLI